jgi:AcrR family transcriptional regulator
VRELAVKKVAVPPPALAEPGLRVLSVIEPAAARRLVISAVESFSDRGYFATTTREISVNAGMSAAALYVHYSSKEEILGVICRTAHRSALDAMMAAQADEAVLDAPGRLSRIVNDLTLWHVEHQQLARVALYQTDGLSEDFHREIVPLRRQILEVVRTEIKLGMAAGLFSVPSVTAAANSILAMGIDVARWFIPDGSMSGETIAAQNAELAVRMVSAG